MIEHHRTRHLLRIIMFGRNPRRTLLRVAVLAGLTYLVIRYALLPTRARGVSMEPTYSDGTFHVVNLLAYRRNEPRRGDIVVITMAGRRAFYLKRVLGLPGERIKFIHGQLHVNGAAVHEPYVQAPSDWTVPEMSLAENEYYVAGDNRNIQWEYHSMGIVDRDKIQGRVLGRRASWK